MSDKNEIDEMVKRAWANVPKTCPVCGSNRLDIHTVDLVLNGAFHGPYVPGLIDCLDCTERLRRATETDTAEP